MATVGRRDAGGTTAVIPGLPPDFAPVPPALVYSDRLGWLAYDGAWTRGTLDECRALLPEVVRHYQAMGAGWGGGALVRAAEVRAPVIGPMPDLRPRAPAKRTR